MLNVIFVSDNFDFQIGDNCALAYSHLIAEVDFTGNNIHLLDGNNCTAENVEHKISSFEGKKFILVAFSHGTEDSLKSSVEDTPYIHPENCYFFGSSFVYTNSCYAGLKLKDELASAGCLGFVGYNDEVRLPKNHEDDILFIECENSGLINFLNTENSLSESVEVMRSAYKRQAKQFLDKKMNLAAAFLIHNLNSLTFYETGTLTRTLFEQ